MTKRELNKRIEGAVDRIAILERQLSVEKEEYVTIFGPAVRYSMSKEPVLKILLDYLGLEVKHEDAKTYLAKKGKK